MCYGGYQGGMKGGYAWSKSFRVVSDHLTPFSGEERRQRKSEKGTRQQYVSS